MQSIKSYTDIEQSKKLAEFLPLESADMFCANVFNKEEGTHSYNFHILSTWGCNMFEELKNRENKFVRFIPCWSLAALLGVLPEKHTELIKEGGMYRIIIKDSYMTCLFDNPVDACCEMILKLNELNLL